MSLNFTFTNNFSTDNFDKFVFDSRYYVNFYEEKLLIYSILFTEFIFNIADIGLRYYIDNTSVVNMILLSVFFYTKFIMLL